MNRGIPTTIQILAALAFVAVMLALVGNFDYADALTQEAIAKDARGAAAIVDTLSHPLPYSATVTQSGDGIAEARTRFYISKSVREAK
jgi:tetrahydromethanopterin S-methyltransferase subunit C